MIAKDYDPQYCSLCRTRLEATPAPGVHCESKSCASYLVAWKKGQRGGDHLSPKPGGTWVLRWHHPQECEEADYDCKEVGPCAIYG